MEAMRESWTDDRLDDLNGKVDALRVEMKAEFVAARGEMKDGFATMQGEIKADLTAMRGEINVLQRTLLQIAGGTIATLIAGIVATQL